MPTQAVQFYRSIISPGGTRQQAVDEAFRRGSVWTHVSISGGTKVVDNVITYPDESILTIMHIYDADTDSIRESSVFVRGFAIVKF